MSAARMGVPLEFIVDSPGREATIRGSLGVRTVAEVRNQLQAQLESGEGDLILHLATAEVSDATGLGVLVGLHQRAARRGRRLVIAEASERLERLLKLTKLHLVLSRTEAYAPSPTLAMPAAIAPPATAS